MLNLYDTLGLARSCNDTEIKKAYKKQALKHHPDKGGNPEDFKKIQNAFDTLSDASKRYAYDKDLEKSKSKDGMNPKKMESARKQQQKTTAPPSHSSTSNVVEIPSDPDQLTVKELKQLLSQLGVMHSDCVEKSDLLDRLANRKKFTQQQPGWFEEKKSPKPTSKANQNTNASSSQYNRAQTSNFNQQATNAQSQQIPKKPVQDTISIKLISVGDAEVGKSCLIKRYCEGRFVQRYITTIGVDYGVKKLSVNFFDLSGSPEYADIRSEFYSNSQAVLLVFDYDNKTTFQNMLKWEREMRQFGVDLTNSVVAVCGNKVDFKTKQVQQSDINKFISARSYKMFDTSANTGAGVNEVFDYLFTGALDRFQQAKKVHNL